MLGRTRQIRSDQIGSVRFGSVRIGLLATRNNRANVAADAASIAVTRRTPNEPISGSIKRQAPAAIGHDDEPSRLLDPDNCAKLELAPSRAAWLKCTWFQFVVLSSSSSSSLLLPAALLLLLLLCSYCTNQLRVIHNLAALLSLA